MRASRKQPPIRLILLFLLLAGGAGLLSLFPEGAVPLPGAESPPPPAGSEPSGKTDEVPALFPEEILPSVLPALEPEDVLVSHTGYTLSYRSDWKQPEWVAYELTAEEAEGNFPRRGSFRKDPDVPGGSASPEDYRGTGYDRGHLCPAGDQRWSVEAMRDSFYMSNMSPQAPGFNRGIWSELEEAVRDFARENGRIAVVTGPVLTEPPLEITGPGVLPVPQRFYKVILDFTLPERKALGFILPNEKSGESLSCFAVPVDLVEEITGLDFFPDLPDDLESLLESEADPALWFPAPAGAP